MTRDTLHSRVVLIAKLCLPLIALGLLAVLFMIPSKPDPSDALPFTGAALSERAQEQRLTNPRFTGTSKGGAAFSLVASSALPEQGNPRKMVAADISLSVDGIFALSNAVLMAKQAAVDTELRSANLSGGVELLSSNGFHLKTERFEADLAQMILVAPGTIEGRGPLGTITAGSLRIDGQDKAELLLFEGGIVMLYQPTDLTEK